MSAELYGLVLTGGLSRRMQRDKAMLEYAGQSQLARAMQLIRPFVTRSFVSIRAGQPYDPQRAAYDTITDITDGLGPIGGIQAALHTHPDKAWLVLACDLPFLDATTLQQLLASRADSCMASAFRSSHDGLPEPLCAIFEPASGAALDAWIAQGKRCPRQFLAAADVRLLDLANPHALDNINTADEYMTAHAALATPATPVLRRRFNVQYFAILREQAGRSHEEVESTARTPQELYQELQTRHGLKLAPQFLRVAVNEDFGDWQQPLADGDRIVFLPPVAGG